MTEQMNVIKHLEPVTMYEIMAKLYAALTKEVTTAFGKEGEEAVRKGVMFLCEEQVIDLCQRTGDRSAQVGEKALFSHANLADDETVEQTFLAYQQAQEEAGLEAHTVYAMMAKMFAHITKAVVDRYGEEGQEAIRAGVGRFGEARGRDIARRAAAAGKPNTIDHYLSSYDMGRSELFNFETTFHPKEIEQTFTKCAFAEQWSKDGMQEHGILYCQMIDPSIAKGYNPNFEVIHDKYVLKEGECHFRFQMKESE